MRGIGRRHAGTVGWLAMGVRAAASCGRTDRDPGVETEASGWPAPSEATDPGRTFAGIEERVLQLRDSRIAFRIASRGAFAADLEGKLHLGAEGEVALDAQGTFGSDSVSLALEAADGRLAGGNGERTFEEPVPAELREALVIGLTRMGLLHNLARLVAGSPPDRAGGGVRDWVQAAGFAWTTEEGAPGAPDARGVAFRILVDGQETADAVLWIDGRGRPMARDQTVRFPGGEMRVREEYEFR